MKVFVRVFENLDESEIENNQVDCVHKSYDKAKQCLADAVLDVFDEEIAPCEEWEGEGCRFWLEEKELEE